MAFASFFPPLPPPTPKMDSFPRVLLAKWYPSVLKELRQLAHLHNLQQGSSWGWGESDSVGHLEIH